MKVLPFIVPKTQLESFHVKVDEADHFYDMLHSHPEIQITYITESYGTLLAGDYTGSFEPGMLFIIGSNQPHVFRNIPEHYESGGKLKARSVSVFVNIELFKKSHEYLPETTELIDFLEGTERGLLFEKQAASIVLNYFEKLIHSSGFTRIVHLFNLFEKLMQAKRRTFLASVANKKSFNAKDGERLNTVFQFTLSEFHRKITNKEVAERTNMTTQSFCRYFKKHTHKSYITFLNEVRIGNSCRLLLNENLSIAQVAYSCGFNNLSNFNRTFKAITGQTPKEFRRFSGK